MALPVGRGHHDRAHLAWEGSAENRGGWTWARQAALTVNGGFRGRARD